MKLAVKISALACLLVAASLAFLADYADPINFNPLPMMIFGIGALALLAISEKMKG